MHIIKTLPPDINVAEVLRRYLAGTGLLPSVSINSLFDQQRVNADIEQLAKADIAALSEILKFYIDGIDVNGQLQAHIWLTLHQICLSTTISATVKQDFIAYLDHIGWLSISPQEVHALSLIPLPNSQRPCNPVLKAQLSHIEIHKLINAWYKCSRLNLKKITAWASNQSTPRGEIAYQALTARSYYSPHACLNLIMVNFATAFANEKMKATATEAALTALEAYREAFPSIVEGVINQVYLSKKTQSPNLMPKFNPQDADLSISQQYKAKSYYDDKALVPKLFNYDPEEYKRSTKAAVGLLTLAVILLLLASFLALALYGPFIHIAVATFGNWLWLSFSTIHLHTFLCACTGAAGVFLYLGTQELAMPGFLQHTKNAVVDLFRAVRKWHQNRDKVKLWQERGLLNLKEAPPTPTIKENIQAIFDRVEELRNSIPTKKAGARLTALNKLLEKQPDALSSPIEQYFMIKEAVMRVREHQQTRPRISKKSTGYRFGAIAKLFGLHPEPIKLAVANAQGQRTQPL